MFSREVLLRRRFIITPPARWARKASTFGVVTQFMEADEAIVPIGIGFLGADEVYRRVSSPV